jgi:hypothetical protein
MKLFSTAAVTLNEKFCHESRQDYFCLRYFVLSLESWQFHELFATSLFTKSSMRYTHRLVKYGLDLQSLFELQGHSCTVLIGLRLIYEGAIGQPRQATPLCDPLGVLLPSNTLRKPLHIRYRSTLPKRIWSDAFGSMRGLTKVLILPSPKLKSRYGG